MINKDSFEERRKVWRRDFPWTEQLVYFHHAFNSPLPLPVITEVMDYFNKQSYMGFVQPDAKPKIDLARKNVADSIGAKASEIAFTQSYTEGLNIATSNIDWLGKDNVVIGEGDYFSTIVHFVNLVSNKKDVELRIIPMDKNGFLSTEEAKMLIDEGTALVHIVHVPNGVGTVQPVREIFDYARKRGAWTIIDAAQSTGIVPHSVKELNCDFYSSVGKKWLMGPVGTAFFWCREDLIESLKPPIVGKHFVNYDLNNVELVDTAERFESTTPNQPGIVGLGEAVRYWEKISVEAIAASIYELIKYLIERLVDDCNAAIIGTQDVSKRTGITCFQLENVQESKVVEVLKHKYNIVCGSRVNLTPARKAFSGDVVRVSTHYYNSLEDIDRLIQALLEIQKNKIN
jgi:cysteine desulfurase/selenocysteine lyase